jgi:hypothetical protein
VEVQAAAAAWASAATMESRLQPNIFSITQGGQEAAAAGRELQYSFSMPARQV